MVRVDIVFDHYSSQLQVIRGRVLRAFLELELEPHWHEWDLRQENLPEAVAVQSSLAVLVDGVDVLGMQGSALERVYRYIGFFDGGAENLPSILKITQAMKSKFEASGDYTHPRVNLWLPLTVIPVLLVAFFMDEICMVCGVQGMGIPMMTSVADVRHILGFLLPVVLFCLFFAMSGFVYRAKERNGYKPLIMGAFFASLLLYGSFVVGNELLFWSGGSGLLLAAFWNAQLKSPQASLVCPRCPVSQTNAELLCSATSQNNTITSPCS